jgi:hypothetical protein
MGERMAAVETRLETIEGDVGEIKRDVKSVLLRLATDDGAARQRSLSRREFMGLMAGAGGLAGILLTVLDWAIDGKLGF